MHHYLRAHVIALTVLTLVIGACGRNDTTDRQQDQRSTIAPLLRGAWVSQSEQRQVNRLVFDENKLTIERVSCFDPECTDRERTLRQTGKYTLSSTFKEGILNSIVFESDTQVGLTLHTEYDVDRFNNSLVKIHNEEEKEIPTGLSPAQKKQMMRENLKIRASREISPWRINEEKVLSRLQAEKIFGYETELRTITDMGTRYSFRYEIDNGILQLSQAGELNRVYTKQ